MILINEELIGASILPFFVRSGMTGGRWANLSHPEFLSPPTEKSTASFLPTAQGLNSIGY